MDGWIWYMRDPKRREGACIRFSTLHECAYNAFSLYVVHYHSSSSALRRRIVEGQRLLISLCMRDGCDAAPQVEWEEGRVLSTRICSSLEGSILAFTGRGLDFI